MFYSDDKFKSAPSVIDMNNEIIIVVGDDGGHLYGINIDGTLKFDLVTNDNISSEAGFIEFNNQEYGSNYSPINWEFNPDQNDNDIGQLWVDSSSFGGHQAFTTIEKDNGAGSIEHNY